MRKYKYNDVIEELKTKPSEITISEFQSIVKNEKYIGNFMYYLDAFQLLGLSESFIDLIDDKTLYIMINDFQEDFQIDNKDYVKEIEVDGYKYTSYDDEFKLGARDLANIEERMHKDPYNWFSYALSIIFKRDDLSIVEHKTPAHIKHKESLFRNLTMDIAMPYIYYISENYISNVKLLMKND